MSPRRGQFASQKSIDKAERLLDQLREQQVNLFLIKDLNLNTKINRLSAQQEIRYIRDKVITMTKDRLSGKSYTNCLKK